MKLALGTVQFGLDYGAFNAAGRVDERQAGEILDVALAAGIDTLDTARAYGTSEDVLGALNAATRFRIVTKIAALGAAGDKRQAVTESLATSRASLRTERLDAVLFHSAGDLLGPDAGAAWDAAERVCADGHVGVLGVSVYDADEALAIADRFPIRLVQLPVSIFDQRALASGALDRLKARGIEVHARSVFLQGFALSDPDHLPAGLARFAPTLATFRDFAARNDTSPLAAAVGFVLSQSCIDRLVVGVQSGRELQEICLASQMPLDLASAEEVASSELQLLNPGLWPANGE